MKRQWFHTISTALGVTTICCLWLVGPLISPSHRAIFHWSGPASTIFVPSVLDFMFVWFFFTILLSASQDFTRQSVAIWSAVTFFVPLAALKTLYVLMGWYLPHWASLSMASLCAFSFVVINTQFAFGHRKQLERLQNLTIQCFRIVAISGAIILLQLAWFGWQARELNLRQPLHQPTNTAARTGSGRPRIIWILFDELSYQQVYGHRFHNLNLPAFDQLAEQSTIFTNVTPAGIMTEVVMPSLLAGVPVDEIQPSATGKDLKLHNSLTNRWQIFDPKDTIFQDAISYGYSTAIAGWFIPYCRILPLVVDQCSWTFDELPSNKMAPYATIARNTVNPFLLNSSIMNHLPFAINHGNNIDEFTAQIHISEYQRISDAADGILQNPTRDFVLIHISVPHPGGIYSRNTHHFATRNSSYIDNLALADLYLAHVRFLLESMGQWNSSAVVVMGDHSWRTKLFWAATPGWSPDEELSSNGGQFDDRPAYIVKLPDEKTNNRVNLPFAAVDTRLLFSEIMQKRIICPEELSAWVNSQYRKHPAQ